MYTPNLTRSEAYHQWSGSLDSIEVAMVHLVKVCSGGQLNVVEARDTLSGGYVVESWGAVLISAEVAFEEPFF